MLFTDLGWSILGKAVSSPVLSTAPGHWQQAILKTSGKVFPIKWTFRAVNNIYHLKTVPTNKEVFLCGL